MGGCSSRIGSKELASFELSEPVLDFDCKVFELLYVIKTSSIHTYARCPSLWTLLSFVCRGNHRQIVCEVLHPKTFGSLPEERGLAHCAWFSEAVPQDF